MANGSHENGIHSRGDTRGRAAGILCAALLAWSQAAPSPSDAQQPEYAAEVEIVDVYVTVTDRSGSLVRTLTKDNFRVFEDGVEQTVSHFSSEDAPYTVGLVLDRSGSMTGVLADVFDAALHTLQASKPDDEAFAAVFDHRVDLVQDFTLDRKVLERALDKVRPGGETALYDAVRSALRHIQGSRYRKKALLVVTDGADNRSETAYPDLLRSLGQEPVIVYVVGFFAGPGRRPDEARDVDRLGRLAETTGGKAYFPADMEACKRACVEIASELRQQYSLGYYPSNTEYSGAWRTIRVEVVGPAPERTGTVSIRARAGYYRSRDKYEGPQRPRRDRFRGHWLQGRTTHCVPDLGSGVR